MTRVSFDAKAALAGCADTVVRWCTLPVATNLGLTQNVCKRQKHEYLLSETSILHTSRKALRSFFNLEDPACGDAREKRQVRKEQLGKHGQESFGQANEICKHSNRGMPAERRKTGGDMHKHKE
jgi:hypothetical protein